jgi:hypothetical protein
MTNIDEARKRLARYADPEIEGVNGDIATVLDALDAAERERDEALREMHARELHHFEEEQKSAELAAVIDALVENSLRIEGSPIPWIEIDAQVWDRYLSGTPADALRAVKAEVWDEGRESVALDFTRPLDEAGMRKPTPNPYRETKEQGR